MVDTTSPPVTVRIESLAARVWLERLSSLLPPAEATRVRSDVEAMILDRVEAAREVDPGMDVAVAEIRALEALGSPDVLAEALVERPVRVTWATWRSIQRRLAVLVPCHLLLAILFTAAGSTSAPVPGLLAPLPVASLAATALAVLGIVLVDIGLVVLLYVVFGAHLGRIRPLGDPAPRWSRGDAVRRLVLLGLLAVLINLLLDRLFTIEWGEGTTSSFLAAEIRALVPWANAVLLLFALRDVASYLRPGAARSPLALDVAACLAAAAVFVYAASRPEIVRFPKDRLGGSTAGLLTSLVTRLFVLILVLGALAAVARAVRQFRRCLRVRDEHADDAEPAG